MNKRDRMNWKAMEQLLGSSLPFDVGGNGTRNPLDTSWIGNYVQDVLRRTMPGQAEPVETAQTHSFTEPAKQAKPVSRAKRAVRPGTAGTSKRANQQNAAERMELSYRLFDTHHHTIVRVNIPDDLLVRNLRVHVSSSQLMLERHPRRLQQLIKLPGFVDAGGSRAAFKNGVLEVRMPKDDAANHYHEVGIRHIKSDVKDKSED